MALISEMLYYHHNSSSVSPSLPDEQITYWDMTCILRGRCHYRINGCDYVLHRRDIILMPPGIIRVRFFEPEPLEYISFNFLIPPETSLPLPLYIGGGLTPVMDQALCLYPDRFIMPDCFAKERLTAIAEFVLYELQNKQNTDKYSPHVCLMLKTIRKRIYEPLSLSAVSAAAGLSLSYAANLFKKEVGCTIGDYILRQKMLLARDMIFSGEMSMKEIAEKLGYTNYSYFSAQFRNQYSCSPSHLKKRKNT